MEGGLALLPFRLHNILMASSNNDNEKTRISAEPDEKLKKPWKYLGYRAYSSFLASDDNFLVFRRFGNLNARVLLFLQDQICRFEERLEELDALHSAVSLGVQVVD